MLFRGLELEVDEGFVAAAIAEAEDEEKGIEERASPSGAEKRNAL